MENSVNQNLLFDKLQKNYDDFADGWNRLNPTELIEKSEEINSTQLVKEHLLYTVTEHNAAYLLKFQNPLELVRDKWMEENGIGVVHDQDISHAVWSVIDFQDSESLYALEEEAEPPVLEQGVSMC